MKDKYSVKNSIKQMAEGRAARACAVVVSAFLCILTLLEFTALYLEWELPVLAFLNVENSFWSEEYQREELALDESIENELLESAAGRGADGGNAWESAPTESAVPEMGTEAPEIPDEGGTVTAPADSAEVEEETEPVVADVEFPYYIRVNRKQNCITVYTMDEDGAYTIPYRAMICSTGLYNATPRGTFQISTKYLWRELYGGVYGQYATRIYGGVLFHSVPYYRKDKSALCTDKYNKLGQQASMGCVRLTVEDAKWIAENCPAGTTVEIYDDDDPGPLGKPDAVRLDPDSPIRGWDPTDPDEANPWGEMSEDS